MITTLKYARQHWVPAQYNPAVEKENYIPRFRDDRTSLMINSILESTDTYVTVHGSLLFDEIVAPPYQEGLLFYHDNSLSFYNDEPDIQLNIGEELYIRVKNETGATIPNGSVVAPLSLTAEGDITVQLANAHYRSMCSLVGVATHDIEDGGFGYVTRFGSVTMNTSMFSSEGAILYLSWETPGAMTPTRPTGGNYVVIIGALKEIGEQGSIVVDISIQDLTAEAVNTTGFSTEQESLTDLSFENTTRTFTISPNDPTHTHFYYYNQGHKIDKFSAESIVISDVHGVHFIYFRNGTLEEVVNPSREQIVAILRYDCPVASVFWNTTTQVCCFIGNHRHGIGMTGDMLSYLYFTDNVRFINGLELISFNLATAQFGVQEGAIMVSDIIENIGALTATTGMPIGYLSGPVGEWFFTTNPGYSFIVDGGILQWNEWTGTTWQLSDVGLNDYMLMHIFAANRLDGLPMAILGQHTFNSKADAQLAAGSEVPTLIYEQLPIKEMMPIGTIILARTAAGTQIQLTAEGTNYIDWRLHSFAI